MHNAREDCGPGGSAKRIGRQLGPKYESGAYILEFQNGKYAGKGISSRMFKSIKRIENKYHDKLVRAIYRPAKNTKEAFIKEYELMLEHGIKPGKNVYNKIWSPGKKLSGD